MVRQFRALRFQHLRSRRLDRPRRTLWPRPMAARASLDRRGRRADLAAFPRFRERGAEAGPCQLAFPPDPPAARAAPYPRADDAHRPPAAGAAGAGRAPRPRPCADEVPLSPDARTTTRAP